MSLRARILRFVLAAAAALPAACASPRVAAPAATAGEPIADGITMLRGRFIAGAQPDGNTVLLRAPRGWIVVDTGRSDAHARGILDAMRVDGRPLAAIVNTHWHLDHVAGNVALRDAFPDVEVWASPRIDRALEGFLGDYRRQLIDAVAREPDAADAATHRAEIARIDAGPRLRPTRPVGADVEVTIGGRALRLAFEAMAVSGGDVWLWDPATRVLVAGDLVTLPAPLFDTACPQGWRDALGRLDAVPFVTLVPGHGAPMDREGFAAYRRAFEDLLVCTAGDGDAASCREGWLRDADALVPASDVALARSLLDYDVALLRAPRRAAACAAP